jgi:hypothetical protein
MNSTYCTDTSIVENAILVPDTDVANDEIPASDNRSSNLMFVIETLDGSVISVRCNDKKISEEACFVAVDHSNPEDGGGDNNRLFAKIDGVELESENTYFVNDTIYNPKITVWAAF